MNGSFWFAKAEQWEHGANFIEGGQQVIPRDVNWYVFWASQKTGNESVNPAAAEEECRNVDMYSNSVKVTEEWTYILD